MELKEKVYEQFVSQQLFNKNCYAAIGRIAKALKTSEKNIVLAIKELQDDKALKFKKKSFVNLRQPLVGIFHETRNNFGFVTIDEYDDNFYVSNTQDALDGDKVQVYINNSKSNPTAFINKVIERNKKNIIGRVIKTKSGTYALIPDNQKFGERIALLQNEETMSAVGKKCSITILDSTTPGSENNGFCVGKINKIFGMADDPIVENIAIAYKHGFVKQFNQKVQSEIASIPTYVSEDETIGREDFRDINFVTIDPASCKDMDDAVYVEKTATGYKIMTAIADVGYYVERGSNIDKEAYMRGTSCYLGDGVYPMLPEELSNGICSLNEKVDRLARVTIINLDKLGNIIDYKLCAGVINSKHKLSYDIVDKIHFDDKFANDYTDIKQQIDLMFKISDILVEKRKQRGAIFLNNKEADYMLDETKTSVELIKDHNLLESTKIIESFMLITNEVVGDYFTKNHLDTLFRVHAIPDDAKLKELNSVLKQYDLPPVSYDSKSYQKVTEMIKNTGNEDYITLQLLKSLQKAVYQPYNIGHFGLASKNYIQFTSPIRRYPDLIAHRILYAFQNNLAYKPSFEQLTLSGEHLSKREIDAKDAEQESNEFMNLLWAQKQENKILSGKIFEINATSVIVVSNLVQFKIPIVNFISEGYRLNDKKTKLVNQKTNKSLKPTDIIKFKISSIDMATRTIKTSIVLDNEQSQSQPLSQIVQEL